jgi:hypothetical protein
MYRRASLSSLRCVTWSIGGLKVPSLRPRSPRISRDSDRLGRPLVSQRLVSDGVTTLTFTLLTILQFGFVWPEFDSGRRFSPIELKKIATQGGFPLVQLIDGYSNLGFVRGADGFGVFAATGDRSTTTAVSFAFDTGEIWSLDTYIVNAIKQHAGVGGRLGMPYFEDRFKYAAHMFRMMLSRLGVNPPLRWIAGIEGIKNVGLYFPAPTGQYFPVPAPHGKSLVDIVWDTGIIKEDDTPASGLHPFFKKMFNTFGVERPEYLDGLSNPK